MTSDPSNDNPQVPDEFAALTRSDRVRLLARFARAKQQGQLHRLWDNTPEGERDAYKRALDRFNALNEPLAALLDSIRFAIECEAVAVREIYRHYHCDWDSKAIEQAWALLGYPVTETEYRTIVKLELGEPLSDLEPYCLDDFAGYLDRNFSAEDAEVLCTPIAEWMCSDEATGDDEAVAHLRAIIDAAIVLG